MSAKRHRWHRLAGNGELVGTPRGAIFAARMCEACGAMDLNPGYALADGTRIGSVLGDGTWRPGRLPPCDASILAAVRLGEPESVTAEVAASLAAEGAELRRGGRR